MLPSSERSQGCQETTIALKGVGSLDRSELLRETGILNFIVLNQHDATPSLGLGMVELLKLKV